MARLTDNSCLPFNRRHFFSRTSLGLGRTALASLTYKHQGRYYRLTDVAGKVVKGIIA
jgi:hypothetical protein